MLSTVIMPDTEEATGSNPVSPTSQASDLLKRRSVTSSQCRKCLQTEEVSRGPLRAQQGGRGDFFPMQGSVSIRKKSAGARFVLSRAVGGDFFPNPLPRPAMASGRESG